MLKWLLFVSIPVIWVTARHTRLTLSPRRRRVVTCVRALLLLLLLLSLFDFSKTQQRRRRGTWFLVDCSHSVGEAGYQAARSLVERSCAGMDRGEQAGVMLFASRPQVVRRAGESVALPDRPPPSLDRNATNAEDALRLASMLFPASCGRRVILLGDGCETNGAQLAAAQDLRRMGIRVHTVAIDPEPRRDALVERIALSESHVQEGASVEGQVFLRATAAMEGTLTLVQDGMKLAQIPVDLKPGQGEPIPFDRSFPQKGFYSLEALLEVEGDEVRENNRALAFVDVSGQPLVLLIDGKESDTRYLRRALEAERIRVETRPPTGVPRSLADVQRYDLVIFSDLSALKLDQSQMKLVKLYVSELGGGFMMLGGENSFGLGGYFNTPIAEVLPVDMTGEREEEKASAAVVLALDKSGSMSGAVQGARKIDVVKEGAIEVSQVLKAWDKIGVVIFDSNASWLVPLTHASKKKEIAGLISTLAAGGGTNVYPALQSAHAALRATLAKVKHVILLSDGQTAGSGYEELAARINRDRITVSTIAIGQGAHGALMQSIAAAGGGKFHFCDDIQKIPRIFTQDTMRYAGSALKERPFTPKVVQHCHALSGIDFDQAPFLLGYVLTKPKETAQVPLVSPANDPILATWRYGLGKAVAFTSDAKNRWARLWAEGWPDWPRFWSQLVRDTIRDSGSANVEAEVVLEDRTARVTARVMDASFQFVNAAPVSADVFVIKRDALRPEPVRMDTLALRQTAPGEYQGEFEAVDEGAYVIVVNTDYGRARGGFSYSFSREFLGLQADKTALKAIAETTGGKLIEGPDDVFRDPIPPVQVPNPLHRYLLAAAAVLLILDVAIRRVQSWREILPFPIRGARGA